MLRGMALTACMAVVARHRPLAAVSGVLKGYDQLLNLVLDEAVEYLRGKIAPAQVGHTAMAQTVDRGFTTLMVASGRGHAVMPASTAIPCA